MDHCTTCSDGMELRYFKNYKRDGLMCNEFCLARYCPECGRSLSKILKNQKKDSADFDAVKNPSHYCEGRKYEPIEVIKDWDLDFDLGNCIKYVSRAGRKDDILQDLNKAKFYLEHEIKTLEDKNGR